MEILISLWHNISLVVEKSPSSGVFFPTSNARNRTIATGHNNMYLYKNKMSIQSPSFPIDLHQSVQSYQYATAMFV